MVVLLITIEMMIDKDQKELWELAVFSFIENELIRLVSKLQLPINIMM